MDGSSSGTSSVIISEPNSDYVEEVNVETNEVTQGDTNNTPNDQVEEVQIGTTNTDANESPNEKILQKSKVIIASLLSKLND